MEFILKTINSFFFLKKQQRLEDWECEEIFFNWKINQKSQNLYFKHLTFLKLRCIIIIQNNKIKKSSFEKLLKSLRQKEI